MACDPITAQRSLIRCAVGAGQAVRPVGAGDAADVDRPTRGCTAFAAGATGAEAAAGADEVSTRVAALFGGYAREYQAH
ncbi:PE family protein, partial [Mycobacterium shinjukuense]|uniref:PE family protein n=1 Tax=Mycobacterium shinjukuense TaxID=398694 RepID=UPI001301DDF3